GPRPNEADARHDRARQTKRFVVCRPRQSPSCTPSISSAAQRLWSAATCAALECGGLPPLWGGSGAGLRLGGAGRDDNSMKVLLLVHSLDVGGTELMVAHLARHLRASGDEVEVGCLGALGAIGEDLRAEGIPVLVHARGPSFDATLPLRLAQRVRA